MKYRLSIRDLAEQDLVEAYDFYEEKQAGLENDLHDEVAELLNRIADNPWLYPRSELSRFRMATLSRFPLCIYYSVFEDLIVVIAIHDARRDPERWQQRK